MIGNPFDVMKTKMMTTDGEKPNLGRAMAAMYRDRGLGGFYRGVSVRSASRSTCNFEINTIGINNRAVHVLLSKPSVCLPAPMTH